MHTIDAHNLHMDSYFILIISNIIDLISLLSIILFSIFIHFLFLYFVYSLFLFFVHIFFIL